MVPFLKQVAEHYYDKGDIGQRCFVFPNRRSMVFFRKYLAETVASRAEKPLVVPEMYTINDFFFRLAGVAPADRVRLLLDLYECYARLNPMAEPLDEFVFWGDVILGDFNDIDKYMVDAKQLFTNVADIKQIQDSYSYLSETQRKAIESFISHFSDGSGRLTVDLHSDTPDVKARFLHIWNILYELYSDFKAYLNKKGYAYEGMVHKGLAERFEEVGADVALKGLFKEGTSFVFVGLNALHECEKSLIRKLREAHRAECCWDYSGDMIRDPQNRSSFFMEENVREFGQAAQWDPEGVNVPEINVLSVASSIGQAKRLPDILHQIGPVHEDCAVVLPDEGLLVPVLNSIPYDVHDINVTMGLPITGSMLYTLLMDVAAVQLHAVNRKGGWYFYHKQVWEIFSNGLFRSAMDEDTAVIVGNVKKDAKYYIPIEDLNGTPLLDRIFKVVVTDAKSRDMAQLMSFAEYKKDVICAVAAAVTYDPDMALEVECAKECYRSINVLQDSLSGYTDRGMLPLTYVRLLTQVMAASSVPFRGEPLKGLQIMGPLETRSLDFRNLIIMSANEGVFPHRSVSSSFIPPELRKGFGLPTYEYQDAVWAYYFYRMISRAEKVWMLVDSRTEGLKSGEESRYIKQLEYHFGVPLNRMVVKFDSMKTLQVPAIEKTPEDVDVIKKTELSATTIQSYLACPAKFYYGTVKKLKADDEVAESLDYGMFGTVFHDTMQAIYTSPEAMREDFFFDRQGVNEKSLTEIMRYVTKDYIKGWLSREPDIRKKVKALILDQLSAMEIAGRNLVVTDVIVRYVMKTLERDLEILNSSGKDSFEILGREVKMKDEFHGMRIKGYIDRLDSLSDDKVRIVDYKTGKVLDDDFLIGDDNAVDIADSIFAPDVKDRPKIALQFYIYDLLARSREELAGRSIENCVYSTSRIFKEVPESVPLNQTFFDAVSERLTGLIDEMLNPEVGFRRTEDETQCAYCDFKTICGK